MTMGALLQKVRDHLRQTLPLQSDDCAVRPDGAPPPSAGEVFVAVSESGVASDARSHLREVFHIEVSIWRRTGQYPVDRQGELLLPDDVLLAGMLSLDRLERRVVTALHGNYQDLPAALNSELRTGSDAAGDVFQLALYYVGRGASELWPPHGKGAHPNWLGRRLRFEGAHRVQDLDIAE